MRTHHVAFHLALAAGVVAAILLVTGAGLWLDLYRPLGSKGILVFLAAAAAIVFVVEMIAGSFGDWIDERLRRRRAAP